MKTPMQELIDSLKRERMIASNEWQLGYQKALSNIISEIESMLQKEKDVMCDFVEYCDEANRNYQETEESWCEDLTIDDMFDKRFKTDVTNL